MKKFQQYFNVLVTLALCLLVFMQVQPKGREAMSIDFESTSSQYVDFGAIASLNDVASITVSAWIKLESFGDSNAGRIISKRNTSSPYQGWDFSVMNGAGAYAKTIQFVRKWNDTTGGYWLAQPSVVDTGAWYHVVVSYDSSSVDNNPVFYISGTSSAANETDAPVGAFVSDASYGVVIGQHVSTAFDGQIADLRIYNRILSAAEILDIYNARGADCNIRGLVFAPMMFGAATLQAFDGASLAADDLIIDPFSGASGVPAGSPVGRGETYISVGCP